VTCRTLSGDLTIVATGACGGSIKGLVNLAPDFDDPNIYYSFHMYEPHAFTHQRSEKPKGLFIRPSIGRLPAERPRRWLPRWKPGWMRRD